MKKRTSTSFKEKTLNLEKLCLDAIVAVKEAGEFIREESRRWKRDKLELKGHNDIVTYVDKGAQSLLVGKLSAILPDAGFITEEDITIDEEKELTWVIDPLDGTTNYVYGIPIYAVSVGLMKEGKIITGIVYEINQDECFYAWLNGGAYMNGKQIYISQTDDICSAILATGMPHSNFAKKKQYFECLADLVECTRGLRRLGSAAVDLCYVACGRYDIYFELELNPWDVAAGSLIVEEAGGIVNSFDDTGNFLYGREILAGNRILYKEFRETINKYF